MTEEEYKLYREAWDAVDRLPPRSAIAYLDQLAGLNGGSEAVLAVKSVFLRDSGREDESTKLCKHLIGCNRSAWTVAATAYNELSLGEPDGALRFARESVRIDDSNPFALGIASTVLGICGMYDEALEHAKKRVTVDSGNPEAYAKVLLTLRLQHDYQSHKVAVEDSPANFLGTSDHHYAVGQVALRDRRFEDALVSFLAASELTPFRPMVWFSIASAQFRLRRVNEAKASVMAALELSPHNGAALSLAIKVAEATGDFKERERLKLIRFRKPGSTKAYVHGQAADEFLRAGMAAEALRALEMMEREWNPLAKRVATLKKLTPLCDLGRWGEVEKTLALVAGETVNPDHEVSARARLTAHRGNVNSAIERLDAAFQAQPKNGSVLRWLLVFASEEGKSEVLDRIITRWRQEFDGNDSESLGLLAGLYGVKEIEKGDRYLSEELSKYPDSPRLRAVEAWRLERGGDGANAKRIRDGLPKEFRYWRPPSTLRPPKQTAFHIVGRQFKRRFGIGW